MIITKEFVKLRFYLYLHIFNWEFKNLDNTVRYSLQKIRLYRFLKGYSLKN